MNAAFSITWRIARSTSCRIEPYCALRSTSGTLGSVNSCLTPVGKILNVVDLSRRASRHHRVIRNVLHDDRACPNEGTFAHRDALEERRIGADFSQPAQPDAGRALLGVNAQRIFCVGDRDTWTDPATILQHSLLRNDRDPIYPHLVAS